MSCNLFAGPHTADCVTEEEPQQTINLGPFTKAHILYIIYCHTQSNLNFTASHIVELNYYSFNKYLNYIFYVTVTHS